MCVDSICDCVECVIGLWYKMYFLSVPLIRCTQGSSDISLGGESDKMCRAVKPCDNRETNKTKNCADTAGFVLAPLGPCQRWAVASLHAGCLLLAVETGRYQTPKVLLGERACKICNNDKVETEFHFVMECSKRQLCEMNCSLL